MKVYCSNCEKQLADLSDDYVRDWPNSCSIHIEQLQATCSCQENEGTDVVCPDCGEIIGFISNKYAYESPNGSSYYREQLLSDHYRRDHETYEIEEECE